MGSVQRNAASWLFSALSCWDCCPPLALCSGVRSCFELEFPRGAQRAISPLTPAREELISRRGFARSPLRGEGARQAVLFQAALCAAIRAFWLVMQRGREGSERGDRLLYLDARPARTPSPLNGERAGVRGETIPDAEQLAGFENRSEVTSFCLPFALFSVASGSPFRSSD